MIGPGLSHAPLSVVFHFRDDLTGHRDKETPKGDQNPTKTYNLGVILSAVFSLPELVKIKVCFPPRNASTRYVAHSLKKYLKRTIQDFIFHILISSTYLVDKFYLWWNSNHGPVVSETTAIPTESL